MAQRVIFIETLLIFFVGYSTEFSLLFALLFSPINVYDNGKFINVLCHESRKLIYVHEPYLRSVTLNEPDMKMCNLSTSYDIQPGCQNLVQTNNERRIALCLRKTIDSFPIK